MERLKNILGPMIKNRLITYQHGAIFTNFDILKEVIQIHIDTEEKLLRDKDNMKSDGHIDITDQLQIHYEKHKEFLQKVLDLEKELDEHIKLYDYIHLHSL